MVPETHVADAVRHCHHPLPHRHRDRRARFASKLAPPALEDHRFERLRPPRRARRLPPGTSPIEPGLVPRTDVTLSWRTFRGGRRRACRGGSAAFISRPAIWRRGRLARESEHSCGKRRARTSKVWRPPHSSRPIPTAIPDAVFPSSQQRRSHRVDSHSRSQQRARRRAGRDWMRRAAACCADESDVAGRQRGVQHGGGPEYADVSNQGGPGGTAARGRAI